MIDRLFCVLVLLNELEVIVMSGGSYNYEFKRVNEEYVGNMYDKELDRMMEDLVEVLHDLEWWKSCDKSEECYRDTVKKFKEKWLKGNRCERLKEIVDEEIELLKQDLYKLIE
jgi:hypothetical protein